MNVLKAVIVEDEEKGLINLKALLNEHCPEVELIGEARSVKDGLDLLEDLGDSVDVAFLDISLPDGLVFQMLNQIRPITFEIIFVTAYSDYAIKACEYSSIGYILKPIDPDALKESVSRIRLNKGEKMEERLDLFAQQYKNPNAFNKMSIPSLEGIYFVNIEEIVRFEAEDNYTHIYLNTGERIIASKTIKSYEDMLSRFNFYRVHKRHVINLNYLKKFIKDGSGYVLMEGGAKIEVSRRRRPAFLEEMRRIQEI